MAYSIVPPFSMIFPETSGVRIEPREDTKSIRVMLGMDQPGIKRADIWTKMHKLFGNPTRVNEGTDVWKIEANTLAITSDKRAARKIDEIISSEVLEPSTIERWRESNDNPRLDVVVGPEDVFTVIEYPSILLGQKIAVRIKGKLPITTKHRLLLAAKAADNPNDKFPVEFNLSSVNSETVRTFCKTVQDAKEVFNALDSVGLLNEAIIKDIDIGKGKPLLEELKEEALAEKLSWSTPFTSDVQPVFTIRLAPGNDAIIVRYTSYVLRGILHVEVLGRLPIKSLTDLKFALNRNLISVDLDNISVDIIQAYINDVRAVAELEPAINTLKNAGIWRPEYVKLIRSNENIFKDKLSTYKYLEMVESLFPLGPELRPPDDSLVVSFYGVKGIEQLVVLYGSLPNVYDVLSKCPIKVLQSFWNTKYLLNRHIEGSYGLDFETFFSNRLDDDISVFINIYVDLYNSSIEECTAYKYLTRPVSDTSELPLDIFARTQIDPVRLKLFVYNPATSPRDFVHHVSGNSPAPAAVHPTLEQELCKRNLYVIVGPISFFEFTSGQTDFLLMGDAHFKIRTSCQELFPLVPNSSVENVVGSLLETSHTPIHFFLETSGRFSDNNPEFFNNDSHLLRFRNKYRNCWMHNPNRSKIVAQGQDTLITREDWAYWADCVNISSTGQPIYFHYVDYRHIELRDDLYSDSFGALGETSEQNLESFILDILDDTPWGTIVTKYPTLRFKKESKVWRSFHKLSDEVKQHMKTTIINDLHTSVLQEHRGIMLQQLYMDIGTLTRIERVVKPGDLVIFYGGGMHTELYWNYFKTKPDYVEHYVYKEEDPADRVSFVRCASVYSDRNLVPQPRSSRCISSFNTTDKMARALLDKSVMSNTKCVTEIFHDLYRYEPRYKQHVGTKLYENLMWWQDENGYSLHEHPSLGDVARRLLDAQATDPDLLLR